MIIDIECPHCKRLVSVEINTLGGKSKEESPENH